VKDVKDTRKAIYGIVLSVAVHEADMWRARYHWVRRYRYPKTEGCVNMPNCHNKRSFPRSI